MSGHSKWSQIKHKKGINDAKKGKLFGKLSNQLTVAARQKGGDLNTNPQLRMLVEKARSFNMPSENIERAIKKGTGELEGMRMEEFTIEAYGPGGAALIIEGITDNKNRTVSEIKYIISQHEGKMAELGSVAWLFEKKGTIVISAATNPVQKEELELLAIDAGADDLKWQSDEFLEIFTRPDELEKVKKQIEAKGIKIDSFSIDWVPKNETEIADEKSKKQIEKLFGALEENDDVSEIYSNLKNI